MSIQIWRHDIDEFAKGITSHLMIRVAELLNNKPLPTASNYRSQAFITRTKADLRLVMSEEDRLKLLTIAARYESLADLTEGPLVSRR